MPRDHTATFVEGESADSPWDVRHGGVRETLLAEDKPMDDMQLVYQVPAGSVLDKEVQAYLRAVFIRCTGASILAALAAGIPFGFNAIKPMLLDSRVLIKECPVGASSCAQQILDMNSLLSAAALTANFMLLPISMVIMKIGLRWSIVTCGVVSGGSLMLFGWTSVTPLIDDAVRLQFMRLAYILMAIGGSMLFASVNSYPDLLKRAEPHPRAIWSAYFSAIITACWDLSSISPYFLYLMYFRLGLSLQDVCLIFGGLLLALHLAFAVVANVPMSLPEAFYRLHGIDTSEHSSLGTGAGGADAAALAIEGGDTEGAVLSTAAAVRRGSMSHSTPLHGSAGGIPVSQLTPGRTSVVADMLGIAPLLLDEEGGHGHDVLSPERDRKGEKGGPQSRSGMNSSSRRLSAAIGSPSGRSLLGGGGGGGWEGAGASISSLSGTAVALTDLSAGGRRASMHVGKATAAAAAAAAGAGTDAFPVSAAAAPSLSLEQGNERDSLLTAGGGASSTPPRRSSLAASSSASKRQQQQEGSQRVVISQYGSGELSNSSSSSSSSSEAGNAVAERETALAEEAFQLHNPGCLVRCRRRAARLAFSPKTKQLLRPKAFSAYLTISFALLSMYFFMSSAAEQATLITELDPRLSTATLMDAFDLMLPLVGFLCAFVISPVLDGEVGEHTAYRGWLFIAVFGAMWAGLSCISNVIAVLCTYIIFIIWRVACFVVLYHHAREQFSEQLFIWVAYVACGMGGFFILAEFPIDAASDKAGLAGYQLGNILLIVPVVICAAWATWLTWPSKAHRLYFSQRRKQRKQQQRSFDKA